MAAADPDGARARGGRRGGARWGRGHVGGCRGRGRALVGAVLRALRRLRARPTCCLRPPAPGDWQRHARRRHDGDVPRRRDRLPGYRHRRLGGARRRGFACGPADRRPRAATGGGTPRLRGTDRSRCRPLRRPRDAGGRRARDRRGWGGTVRRPGGADRRLRGNRGRATRSRRGVGRCCSSVPPTRCTRTS